jgi:hypothetical protein
MASKRILVVLVAIAYVLFINMNCNKGIQPPQTQADGLPLETQEGKNTFGCYWNDTLWFPVAGIIPAINCTYNPDSNWTNIVFRNEIRKETITMNLLLFDNRMQEFDDKYPNSVEIDKSLYNYESYKCAEPKGLKMIITKFIKPDRSKVPYVKGILSGTFTAKFYKIKQGGKDIDTTDSIIIRKAVFDLEVN